MTRHCTSCGSVLDEDTRFCTNCGTPVDAAEDAATPASQQGQKTTDAQDKRKRVVIIAVVALVIVVVIILAFALGQGTDTATESSTAVEQTQEEASESSSDASLEGRTVATDHFTFVMPESWEGKVTWSMNHQVYSSPRGPGYPDQELFWYDFYPVGGDSRSGEVMNILVTNDATGELGQTTVLGEFKTDDGLDGYINYSSSYLVDGFGDEVSKATMADLQSGGQVRYSASDSPQKREADAKVIEDWMKANVVPYVSPVDSAGSSSAPSATDAGFKGITSARASSTLPTDGINTRDYSAASAIDGNERTCWCENVAGPGINEYLAFSGDSEQTFSGFKILNGHQDSIDLYRKNARATSLRVIVDGEVKETVQIPDNGLGWQAITFAQPYKGHEIALQIDTAVSGSSYDDCCITEIEFF